MAQVNITLNGLSYNLECGDGEEEHLLRLAGRMQDHLDSLASRHGQVGDNRLLLMAGLMFADELAETRQRLEESKAKLAEIGCDRAAADELVAHAQAQIAARIGEAADRIEALTVQVAGGGSVVDGE